MLQIPTIMPLISAILVAGLGLLVVLKKRSRLNILFGLFSLSIVIWLLGTFMMFLSHNYEKAIFWDRFAYLGVIFMPTLGYHFSLQFYPSQKQKKFLILGYVISGIFIFLSRSDYFLNELNTYNWGVHTRAQFLHHIFLIFFAIYIFLFFFNIFRAYKEQKTLIKKAQAKYILISFIILTLGSLAFLPAYGIDIYPVSYLTGAVFTAILAYAVIRYRLLDIRLVAKRSTIYLVSVFISIWPGLGLLYSMLYYGDGISWKVIGPISLLASLIIFLPIKNRLEIIANKYFFASLYDFQQTLIGVSRKLTTIVNLNKLSDLIVQTILKTMQVKKIALLIKAQNKSEYIIEKVKNFKWQNKEKILKNKNLINYLEQTKQALVYEEFVLKIKELSDSKEKTELEKVQKALKKINSSVCLPCISKNQLIAMIVIGEKLSRDAYTVEDIRLLQNLSDQAGIAIDNALLHKQALDFNKVLEKRVKLRTLELEKANIKLKQAIRAKSEFLDIASHQLRTPTSIIRGMLSMVLNDNLTEKEKIDFIEKSFQSANRLTIVISDLLDASEAEDEKLRLNKSPVQIEKILKESVNFLIPQAKEKNLYLKLDLPEKETKKILGDPERIRGVVDNLIDNAIHYTEKGGIKVKLEKNHNHLIISVADTGIGITQKEQKRLFKKFSRGKRAFNIHANGSGLGLFIVKKTIQAHHGKIEIISKGKNKGTCFKVYLKFNM